MYTTRFEGNDAEKHFEVFRYTSKDQTKPLNAAIGKRNCHGACRAACDQGTGLGDCGVDSLCTVRFIAVDDQIAILGSGNQGARTELYFLPFS